MVDTPEQMMEMRKYARFAPAGGRGYFSVSRAVHFGIRESVNEKQQQVNNDLCLMGQIETMEAMERLDELAAVPGVDLFVGPADLAASLGHPGETAHPRVLEAAAKVVRAARTEGKCIASACGPADFKFWIDQKIDLLFCANDIACLKRGAGLALEEARALLSPVR
jgi:2-keto-3-deoxy-L-rhamnonate aldolase RhmA